MRNVGASTIEQTLSGLAAVDAIRDALTQGFDPADDIPRQLLPIPGGEVLVMPSAKAQATGLKVLTVAPDAPDRTVRRIQGQYLLFDSTTLSPRMLLDGAALTSLRTPAVSFAPVKPLLQADTTPLDVVIFGVGAQGVTHEKVLCALLTGIRAVNVMLVSRSRPDDCDNWAEAGSDHVRDLVTAAGLIVCATTAKQPVLEDEWVRSDAAVIAVGSHDPN